MYSPSDVRDLVRELFEEEALALGGLVAIHEVDDDLIWRLVRNMDAVRRRVFRRLDDKDPDSEEDRTAGPRDLKPHPAIEDFLLTLRRT